MINSLCTAVRRGGTVLVGSAVLALIASGAANATTTVTHGADNAPTATHTMWTFGGDNSVHKDVYHSTEPLGDDDICDWINQCIPPRD